MKIFSIISNQLYKNQNVYQKNRISVQLNSNNLAPLKCDTVSFTASKASGEPLRKLAEYGIPDMYTGKLMLTWSRLSSMMENGVFALPLKKLVPILKKYENTMLETEHNIFKIFEKAEKKQPDVTIEDILKQQFQEHQKELLSKQQPIFERLIEKACDLPSDIHNEFMDLMRMTSKKIANDPVVTHFSENEFIYKLSQAAKQIKTKNNHKGAHDINFLIRETKRIFIPQAEEKKKFGRGFKSNKAKMEYQMQPNVLKQNIQNIQYLRKIFENSSIKNNTDIKKIFKSTSAKICGLPVVEPFKRKEFIYDLKNVLKFMKDKKLHAKLIVIAHELPTSKQDVSAFMVKHVNDSPSKIGFYLMKDSLVSIEHIDAKVKRLTKEELEEIEANKSANKNKKKKKIKNDVAGKNHRRNYGLSAIGINAGRSNEPFADFVRKHPETYKTCQMYIDRIIELYNTGKFEKVGLDREYIFEFAETVAKQSPKEKPIILDISKIKA